MHTSSNVLINSDRGVPQGDPLAPSLFLIYINDVPLSAQSNTILFTDDISCYSTSYEALVENVKRVDGWCRDNGLELNVGKSHFIIFRHAPNMKKARIDDIPLDDDGLTIKKVSHVEYLGVTLSQLLSPTNHFEKKALKAKKTIATLSSLLRNSLASWPSLSGTR